MIGLIVIVAVLIVGSAIGAFASETARRVRSGVPGVHARRDEFARDPLARPLRQGCESIEIGVRLDDYDRLTVVRSTGFEGPAASLGSLVIEPLARRVAANGGRVRPGDATPLTLLVEIMETERERQIRAYAVLDRELRRYAYLFSRVAGGRVTLGAVTVSLIGATVPRQQIAAQSDPLVFCDGSFADVGPWGAPVMLVPTVSEHWSWRFSWDGTGPITPEERAMLRQHVAAAHADGRAVRIYGLPDRPARVLHAFWRELVAAGVDVIETGRPRALARFLEAERPRQRPAHARSETTGPLPIWRPRPPRADRAAGRTRPYMARHLASHPPSRGYNPSSGFDPSRGFDPTYGDPAYVRAYGRVPARLVGRVYGRAAVRMSAYLPALPALPSHLPIQAHATTG